MSLSSDAASGPLAGGWSRETADECAGRYPEGVTLGPARRIAEYAVRTREWSSGTPGSIGWRTTTRRW